jgi:hypothetical protein
VRARHVIATGTALLALGGCSSAADRHPAQPPVAAASAAPSATIDAGTLDATSAYLTALGNLDRNLVQDTRAALDNGQEVCVDIEERRSDAEQEKNVATRFAVDATQAKKILALTKDNLCLE